MAFDCDRLYREHRHKLYIRACNIIGDEDTAKDIVNELFCTLLEHPETVRTDCNIIGWLYVRLHNMCIDHLRHKEVEMRNEESVAEALFGNFSETDCQEYEERIERMRHELDRLPPKMRRVLEDFFLNGKQYKEIGLELNISPNTARTHVVRALIQLRKWMLMIFC